RLDFDSPSTPLGARIQRGLKDGPRSIPLVERHLDSARGSHPARIRGWTKIDLFRWSGISASLNIRRDPAQDYWIGIWLLKFGREYSHTNRQKTIKPQLPDLRK